MTKKDKIKKLEIAEETLKIQNEVHGDPRFEELIEARDKEGGFGVFIRVFMYLHEGAFKKMTDERLKESLAEVEINEEFKDFFYFFKEIYALEEKYRIKTQDKQIIK